jgi:hypothetical protein
MFAQLRHAVKSCTKFVNVAWKTFFERLNLYRRGIEMMQALYQVHNWDDMFDVRKCLYLFNNHLTNLDTFCGEN